jgi:hypothetical protein
MRGLPEVLKSRRALAAAGALAVTLLSGAAALSRGGRGSGDGAERYAVASIRVDGKARCNGVLVASNGVLTAKHCVERGRRLEAVFGGDTEQEERRVARVERHPTLDAAILVLESEAPLSARPLLLSASVEALASPGAPVFVATAARDGDASPRVLHGKVAGLSEKMVVEYEAGGLCRGESGAPLLARDAQGEAVLVGLLRGGARACAGPDVFVRADRIAPWVRASCESRRAVSAVGVSEAVHAKR